MTGDAIQIGNALKYSAKDFYIGRNKMFTCGEDSIDTKETENIIISENIIYDFKTWDKKFNPSSNVGGVAVVIHYGPEFSIKKPMVNFKYNNIIHSIKGLNIFLMGKKQINAANTGQYQGMILIVILQTLLTYISLLL